MHFGNPRETWNRYPAKQATKMANPPFTRQISWQTRLLPWVCLLYNNKIMLTVKTANISVLFTHFIYSLKVALILPLCLRCSLLRRGFNWLHSFAQRPRSCSKIPYKIRHVKCSVACEQALLAGYEMYLIVILNPKKS